MGVRGTGFRMRTVIVGEEVGGCSRKVVRVVFRSLVFVGLVEEMMGR